MFLLLLSTQKRDGNNVAIGGEGNREARKEQMLERSSSREHNSEQLFEISTLEPKLKILILISIEIVYPLLNVKLHYQRNS